MSSNILDCAQEAVEVIAPNAVLQWYDDQHGNEGFLFTKDGVQVSITEMPQSKLMIYVVMDVGLLDDAVRLKLHDFLAEFKRDNEHFAPEVSVLPATVSGEESHTVVVRSMPMYFDGEEESVDVELYEEDIGGVYGDAIRLRPAVHVIIQGGAPEEALRWLDPSFTCVGQA